MWKFATVRIEAPVHMFFKIGVLKNLAIFT